MELLDLMKKGVLLIGLGINHKGLASYLKKHEIPFDVIEKWQNHSELTERFRGYDVIFRTPGLPFNSEPIQQALKSGIEVYSQTKLFFDLCPAKIIGVTGTKGKGTTSTLIYNILKNDGKSVYLAGNIGKDPFEFIDKLTADDWVVLELSSFQLQDLHKSPHISVVLKTSSEHLDHHKNTEEYVEAKTNIVRHQREEDYAVLNYDLETTRNFVDLTPAKILWNSTEKEVSPGSFIKNEGVYLKNDFAEEKIINISEVGLIGQFNLENITAAISACSASGTLDIKILEKSVAEFKGLPNRLEFVSEVKGVKFYNDSYSTVPETTIAAISAFSEHMVLIVGGSKKGSDFSRLGEVIAQSKTKAIIAVGQEGANIADASRRAGFLGKVYDMGITDMKKIVTKATEISEKGEVVLLSPAAASFDMFENYSKRGEEFKKEVNKL